MRQIDWDNVQEKQAGSFDRPPVGGYVLTIVEAHEDEEKMFYTISYDYTEGEWEGYRVALNKTRGWKLPSFRKYYTNAAQEYFKEFMIDLQADNPRFDWRRWTKNGGKASELIGLKFGAVIGEEEYLGRDGNVKIAQKIQWTMPIAKIHAGDFKVPELKKLKADAQKPIPDAKPAAPVAAAPSPTYDETQCPF